MSKKIVNILFADQAISEIFADFVESLGGFPVVISSSAKLDRQNYLITEPQYAAKLLPEILAHCLVVANGKQDEVINAAPPAVFLSRPLTEEKLMRAFTQLLA